MAAAGGWVSTWQMAWGLVLAGSWAGFLLDMDKR